MCREIESEDTGQSLENSPYLYADSIAVVLCLQRRCGWEDHPTKFGVCQIHFDVIALLPFMRKSHPISLATKNTKYKNTKKNTKVQKHQKNTKWLLFLPSIHQSHLISLVSNCYSRVAEVARPRDRRSPKGQGLLRKGKDLPAFGDLAFGEFSKSFRRVF